MAEILMRNEVLGGLWELCISVSVVILLLLLIRPAFTRLPRMGMYLLWLMVVLRIAIPYPVSDGIAKLFPEEVSQTVAEVRQKSQPDSAPRWHSGSRRSVSRSMKCAADTRSQKA